MADALTVIIPMRTPHAMRPLNEWARWCAAYRPGSELVIVDDGAGLTAETQLPATRILTHDGPRGFGASLRMAIESVRTPLVAYARPNYPYAPASLDTLVNRLEQPVDLYGEVRRVDAVSGCRTGHAIPAGWRTLGQAYRLAVRVVLGYRPAPLPGWLGRRNHWRSWWLWGLMGVPLIDVTSGLAVFRRSLFDQFPIQSNGDFATPEIFAKLTFMNALLAEEPLPASTAAIPETEFSDFRKVFRNAKFTDTVQRPSMTTPDERAVADSQIEPVMSQPPTESPDAAIGS
jgi:hypothetical protein